MPVIPKKGGPWSLFCTDCRTWTPNTANAEMRKEGFYASSHVCGYLQRDEVRDEDFRRKENHGTAQIQSDGNSGKGRETAAEAPKNVQEGAGPGAENGRPGSDGKAEAGNGVADRSTRHELRGEADGLSGPTIYERQILTNQAVIMGALAELMPNEGADQLLENMYVSAMQTMKILDEADKEKEA